MYLAAILAPEPLCLQVCQCEKFLYFGVHVDAVECGVCGKSVQTACSAMYIDVSQLVKLWKSNPAVAQLLTYSTWRTDVKEDTSNDIYDGSLFQELSNNHDMTKDVIFGLAPDGICLPSKRNAKKGVWVVSAICVSLPPWVRTKKEWIMPFIILPANRQGGSEPNLHTYYGPLSQMLHDSVEEGVGVYNAYTKQIEISRVHILYQVADAPGYAVVVGHNMGGHFGCVQICKQQVGFTVCSTTIFDNAQQHAHFQVLHAHFRSREAVGVVCT